MVAFTKKENAILSMKTSKAILHTEKLQIGYEAKNPIASDISIAIPAAKLIAIIGVNGAGKSTLLKTIAGIQPALKGSLHIENKRIENLQKNELAELISLVLTQQNHSKNLSVIELISLGRHPYTNWLGVNTRQDKIHIAKAIQQVGIEKLKAKKCNELSDGQLQKVMIARTLAQNTPVILMDEPTSHLDMYHKAQVLHLLKNISLNTQKSIVFATHEINLALQLCDEIILINDGKVQQNKPEFLIEKGVLSNLFPKDLIHFDVQSKSFKISTN